MENAFQARDATVERGGDVHVRVDVAFTGGDVSFATAGIATNDGGGGGGLAAAGGGPIAGHDAGLRAVLARAARVAPTRVPVLITGESGTGKELLARFIHQRGPDPRGPFVAVNCGTLPRELAESELFGHERGAFTGAGVRRAGWFEQANGGTLVLDEIGELPRELQPKLLRVLEAGRLRRVGGAGEVAVDVRVLAITWRDLRHEAAAGAFRLDLFHRLAGFELTLPPLRARPGDVRLLALRFLAEQEPEVGRRTISAEALERLGGHDWPGNVRELRNVIRRAAILCAGDRIDADALDPPRAPPGDPLALPSPLAPSSPLAPTRPPRAPPACEIRLADDADTLPLAGRTFDEIERAVLAWALRRHHGNRRSAARALAMARSTFCDKVKRYGID